MPPHEAELMQYPRVSLFGMMLAAAGIPLALGFAYAYCSAA